MEVDHSRYIQLRKLNDVFVHVSREYWNRAVVGNKRHVGFIGNVDAKGPLPLAWRSRENLRHRCTLSENCGTKCTVGRHHTSVRIIVDRFSSVP